MSGKQPAGGRRPARAIWALTLAAAAGAVLLWAGVLSRLTEDTSRLQLPWWLAVAMFVAADMVEISVPSRTQSQSFTLDDIAFAVVLLFSPAEQTLWTGIAGIAIALIIHGRRGPKLFFNVAQLALSNSLSIIVFYGLAGDGIGPIVWGAAAAAAATTMIVSDFAVWAAIRVTEGAPPKHFFVGYSLAIALTNTCVGLAIAVVATADLAAAALLIPVAAILGVAHRAYTNERRKREVVGALNDSGRALQRTMDVETTGRVVLATTRELLRATVATLIVHADDGWTCTTDAEGVDGETRWIEEPAAARAVSLPDRAGVAAPALAAALAEVEPALAGDGEILVGELRAGDEIIGFVAAGGRSGPLRDFTPEDATLLDTLAGQAGSAIRNAQLVGRLERSLAHMTELNRMKDDFVAVVSHELRTPLTSLQGSLRTLMWLGGGLGDDDRTVLLDIMDRQSVKLSSLIEDLLVVARLAAEPIQLSPERVDIATMLADVAAERGRLGQHIDVEVPPGLEAQIDRPTVMRILEKLADNAFKHSATDVKVTLTAAKAGDLLELAVADTGPGVAEEDRGRIFERFWQPDQSSTRLTGGLGLGLYISRQLAEAMGGTLTVRPGEAGGSVFELLLPARAALTSPQLASSLS